MSENICSIAKSDCESYKDGYCTREMCMKQTTADRLLAYPDQMLKLNTAYMRLILANQRQIIATQKQILDQYAALGVQVQKLQNIK